MGRGEADVRERGRDTGEGDEALSDPTPPNGNGTGRKTRKRYGPKPKDKAITTVLGGTTVARKDTVLRRLERTVGKGTLGEMLEVNDDPRAQEMLRMLTGVEFRSWSLPTIMRKTGVTYPQLLDWIRRAKGDEALTKMMLHLPEVMEDIAVDSKSRVETCWVCDGAGRVPKPETVEVTDSETGEVRQERQMVEKPCHNCHGRGKVRISGDPDARKQMLEAAGMTGKRGPLVAVQVNAGGVPSAEEDFATIGKVLDAGSKTTEVSDANGSRRED